MTPNPYQREVAISILERFPALPTLTIAKIAYRDHKELWNTLEACRTYFRTLRGNSGERLKRQSKEKRFVRPNEKAADPFGKLPQPLTDIDNWCPVVFDGACKALLMSDIHVPYYDKTALVCALQYGKDRGADTIILDGDTCDFFSISKWEKDPRRRDFAQEVRAIQDFFITLRDLFPRARIIFKMGNHEDRFERYMWIKAPELLNLPQLQIEELLGLATWDIQCVKDMRPMRFGKLNVIHGHEYRFAISNPVSPARGLLLRAKRHAMCGHFHQSSQQSEGTLEIDTISTWSSGCLCDLHPRYNPINNWNHGFIYFEVDKAGTFTVNNLRIVHGKAF